MFDGFVLDEVPVGEVTLRVRHGGGGPAAVLLHGHPRTHTTWHAVAPRLAVAHAVVAPDLRGYGRSTLPPDAPDHSQSSKRAMANDVAALMTHLGHERFAVVGHDRGSLVAFRAAMDHAERVTHLVVMDGLPVIEHLERTDATFAAAWWHWWFLGQTANPAERVICADPDEWYSTAPASEMGSGYHADVWAALRNPDVVHGMAEDYRAGLGVDRAHDAADRAAGRAVSRLSASPVLTAPAASSRARSTWPLALVASSKPFCRNSNRTWQWEARGRTVVDMTELDPSTLHAPEYWNGRYSARDPVWSGKVNQRLAEQTESLSPGDALDIGCGEGGDAVWLAQRGWTVTAVDVSDVVIEKARAHAARTLPQDVAARIVWHPADVRTWQPPENSVDLVSMQYIHLTEPLLADVQARLAGSVRPGGVLLIVNHDPLDLQTTVERPNIPGIMLAAPVIVAKLDPSLWQVEIAQAVPRSGEDRERRPVVLHDTVVRAVRR